MIYAIGETEFVDDDPQKSAKYAVMAVNKDGKPAEFWSPWNTDDEPGIVVVVVVW